VRTESSKNPFNMIMKILFLTLFLIFSCYGSAQIAIDCSGSQCSSNSLISTDPACESITNQAACEQKVTNNYCNWIKNGTSIGGYCTSLPQSINCSGYNCDSTGNVVGGTSGNMSVIKLRGIINSDISVTSQNSESPENLGLVFNAGKVPGVNATVSLYAQNQTSNAGNAIIIGDMVNSLTVNLNGYSGKQGENASEICADNIKNNLYGTATLNYFNQRRSNDSTINPNACDSTDLNYMQALDFTCDDPTYTEVSSSNPLVQVYEIPKKATCTAIASYNYCVKRTVTVSCNYSLWSSYNDSWVTPGQLFSDTFYNSDSLITRAVSYPYASSQGTGSNQNACTSSYQSCGPVNVTCGNVSNGSGYSPGIVAIETAGTNNSNNGFNYAACSFADVNGTPFTCSSNSQKILNTQGYYLTSNCTNYSATLPLQRTLNSSQYPQYFSQSNSLGEYDENFFISESNRLGGIDGFCDAYAPPSRLRGDSNLNSQWWGATGGITPPTNGIYQTGGIPLMAYGNPTTTLVSSTFEDGCFVQSDYMTRPTQNSKNQIPASIVAQDKSSFNLNYSAETSQYGGYSPSVFTGLVGQNNNVVTNLTLGTNIGGAACETWYSNNYNIYQTVGRDGYWKSKGSTFAYTSPNLNPDGLTLASGSDWQVSETNLFESCPAGWSTLKSLFTTLIAYTDPQNTACSGVSDPQDPNNRAFWQYTGISQPLSNPPQPVSCTIGACAVANSVSNLTRSLGNITPANGQNGTEQGNALIFIYDAQNVSTSATVGGPGIAGLADINISPQTRTCVKVSDAKDGLNTPEALTPYVSYRVFQWQALTSSSGGNPGSTPFNTGKKVNIYKKIDPAERYLLDHSLLNTNTN